jgi:hypothetical protein
MGRETICSTSDTAAAAIVLGGRFDLEDCSFFETCSHRVQRYDVDASDRPLTVELRYCAIDWTKAGPLAVLVLLVLFWAYRRSRSFKTRVYEEAPRRLSRLVSRGK